MKISLNNIGKRYNREWIFREISCSFAHGSRVAITGGNGSGKSTLLQLLGGYITPSAGKIEWQHNERLIPVEDIFRHLSWATPNVSMYDDFTLRENFDFFTKFKSLRGNYSSNEFAASLHLEKHLDKPLREYSSGMRQRVKLGFAILAESSLLLLDEPVSHLDESNTKWYQELLTNNASGRTIFIASNNSSQETFICNQRIIVEDFRSLPFTGARVSAGHSPSSQDGM